MPGGNAVIPWRVWLSSSATNSFKAFVSCRAIQKEVFEFVISGRNEDLLFAATPRRTQIFPFNSLVKI